MFSWFRLKTGDADPQESTESTVQEIYRNTFGNPYMQTPFGRRYMICADSTASGSYYIPIENYVARNVAPYYNNTHSNAFGGQMMNWFIQQAKDTIAKSVGIYKNPNYRILFTGNGCTGAIQHVIHMLNLRDPKEDAVVFITEAEHHSNDLPWRHLPIDLVVIPVDKTTGLVELPTLRSYLKKYSQKTLKLISFIAVSNITGVIQPLDEICKMGHSFGALVMFDFATGSPYLPIQMSRDDESGNYMDIITVSTHKFLGGPTTPGVLIFKTTCCRNDVPFCPGGGTVRFVTSSFQKYSDDIETRENGGTPNIVGSIRAGLCFSLKDKYQSTIKTRELWLVQYVQQELLALGDKIQLLNPVDNMTRIAIFSFRVPNQHYNFIVTLLNDLFGIQTRGGISCCSMYAQKLLGLSGDRKKEVYKSIVKNKGVPGYYGWCRITFHYAMPKHIVDYILRAIEFVATHAPRYKSQYVYDPKKNLWYNNVGQTSSSELDMAKIRGEILEALVTNTLAIAENVYPTRDDLNAIFTLNENSLPPMPSE